MRPPIPPSCFTERRNRKGIDCARDSQPQLSARTSLCAHELRRDPFRTAGKRTVRTREGSLHRSVDAKKGQVRVADRGSLFLDEIGDISLELQPKLLRAVQEQDFERLGSSRTISVNVRMIAATHRALRAMIRFGKFREDLFYRFNVFPIEIPPLRERREDIPLLVNYFVSKFSGAWGDR